MPITHLTRIPTTFLTSAMASRHHNRWYRNGKVVFSLGVVMAVGLMAMVTTACSALPDSFKTERQIANEIVECQLEQGDGLGITFLGGKDSVAELYAQSATKEQLIRERDKECGTGDD